MLKRLKTIGTLLFLIIAMQAVGQTYVIDSVCVDTSREYRMKGEAGSTYSWLLTDGANNPVALANGAGTAFTDTDPDSGNPVVGTEISIVWTKVGTFTLKAIQYSAFGCDTLEQGTVKVFELPLANAGRDTIICPDPSYLLATATAYHFSTLRWTRRGDGTFDNDTTRRPTYFFGPKDLEAGKVTLFFTAEGEGSGGTCEAAVDSMEITFQRLTAQVDTTPITCYQARDASIKVTNPGGGLGGYQYSIDQGVNWQVEPLFVNLREEFDYIVQVKAGLSPCATTIDTIRFVDPKPLAATATKTDATCMGNDGTITVVNPENAVSGTYEFAVSTALPTTGLPLQWQSEGEFEKLSPDTFLVWIRDSLYKTCELMINTLIIKETTPLAAAFDTLHVTCYGGSNGSIKVTNPVGGSGRFEYALLSNPNDTLWTSNVGFTDLRMGEYELLMRDSMSTACLITVATIQIKQPDQLKATPVPIHVTCHGGMGGIQFTGVSGGNGPAEFSVNGVDWSKNEIDSLVAATYTIQMRDSRDTSCIVSLGTLIIDQPDKILATLDAGSVSCYGGIDGRLTVGLPVNGTAPYSFSKDGGATWQTDFDFPNLTAGTYSIQVKDDKDCIAILDSVKVGQPQQLVATLVVTRETVTGENDGTITVDSYSGGSGEYQFSLDKEKWRTITLFDSLAPGEYIVWTLDANTLDCMVSDTIIVPSAGTIAFKFTVDPVKCFGESDGVITFTEMTGATDYEYSVDGGTNWYTNPVFDKLAAKDYQLMVRSVEDETKVSETVKATVDQPERMVAIINKIAESNSGLGNASIEIQSIKGGSGGYQFRLNGGAWGDSLRFSGLTEGSYTIGIKDKNDCPMDTIISIPKAGSLTATVEPTHLLCYGVPIGTLTFSGSGATSFQYSIDGGNTWSDSAKFTGLAAGDYTPQMRDAANTSNFVKLPKVTIKQPDDIQVGYSDYSPPLCAGGSGKVTITAKGGTPPYKFTRSGGILPDTGTTGTFSITPGSYKFYVEDKNGCKDSTDFFIKAPDSILAAAVVTSPGCFGEEGTVIITASGGEGDLKVNGLNLSTEGTIQMPVKGGDKYSFKVTDQNNCDTIIAGVMPQPDQLKIAITPESSLCLVSSGTKIKVVVSATGGKAPYIGTGTFEVSSGKHIYTVTDSLGCTAVDSIDISQKDPPDAPALFVSVEPTCLVPTATLEVTAPLGANYLYRMNGGRYTTEFKFDSLAPGSNYTVMVKDSLTQCESAPTSITIGPLTDAPAAPDKLKDLVECIENPIQTLDANNALDVALGDSIVWYDSPVGGNVIASPTWNQQDSVTYYAEAIVGFCRSATRTAVKLTLLPAPAVPVSMGPLDKCAESPIQTLHALSAIEKVNGITITWYDALAGGNVVNSPILDTLGTKTYYAQAGNGTCFNPVRTPVTLTLVDGIKAPVSIRDLAECADSLIQTLDANSAIKAETGITLTWYDKATGGNKVTNPTLSKIDTVTYYAEASNGSCVTIRTAVKLTIHPNPATPVADVVSPTCNNSDGSLVVLSPTGADFMYSMDGGDYQVSTKFDSLKSGPHFIIVKNTVTGCLSSRGLVKVLAKPESPVLTAEAGSIQCFGDTTSIVFTVTNADSAKITNGDYTITYEGGKFSNVRFTGGKSFPVIVYAGNYRNLSLTNPATGCDSYDPQKVVNLMLGQPSEIVIGTDSITQITLKSPHNGAIYLNVTGGTGKYRYLWDNDKRDTTSFITNLAMGDYTVKVIDGNGCRKEQKFRIPAPNNPPVAVDDAFGPTCKVITGRVLINDKDDENDELFTVEEPVVAPLHGKLNLREDGSFVYVPDPLYSGKDSFVYALYDYNMYPNITATVTLTIIADMDGDRVADEVDPDADADGILNVDEALSGEDWHTADADGDGLPNYLDIDSDGDGIGDNFEAQTTADYRPPVLYDADGNGSNGDGINDAYDLIQSGYEISPVDTDKDGIPDFLDPDSDNDHVLDYIEGHDADSNGIPDNFMGGKDSDGDGLDDVYDIFTNECDTWVNATGNNAAMQDFDHDGKSDWRDVDDDDDKILTEYEDMNGNGDYSDDDIDYDGYPEYLDFGRDCDLLIPDAFSPNGDGVHDVFQIYCINHYPNAKMYIFDQMGTKLYEMANYGNREMHANFESAWWNGKPNTGRTSAKAEKVAPGTYYYVLDLGNGEVKKSFVFVSY